MRDSLTPVGYIPRTADREVAEALKIAPVVVVEGAKACGKTWIGRNHACSEASVWHFRDSYGNEIDAIVDWGDRRRIAVEVKLGSMNAVDEAAGSLNRVCAQVDAAVTGPPARKVVITAGGFGYDRPDGVAVVPLTALTA